MASRCHYGFVHRPKMTNPNSSPATVMNSLESGHLSPEDYVEFIDQYREGRILDGAVQHLVRWETASTSSA